MRRLVWVGLVCCACGGAPEVAVRTPEPIGVVELEEGLVERALGGDGVALEQLRDAGPGGLAAVIEAADAGDVRWVELIDAVAQQRDATYSELYWYTDLAKAREAATASGRAILSLRLLGKLTDEYSCANSRFFRTALYSHPELAAWLRAHFILHWSSERAVPKVTVDYGDGRTVQRTITGNSAHYVLDAEGRPIDVLPGLYGPQAFRDAPRGLSAAARFAQRCAGPAGTRSLPSTTRAGSTTRSSSSTSASPAWRPAARSERPCSVQNGGRTDPPPPRPRGRWPRP